MTAPEAEDAYEEGICSAEEAAAYQQERDERLRRNAELLAALKVGN